LVAAACGSSGDPGTSGGDAVVDTTGGGGDVVDDRTPDTAPTPNPCPTGHVPGADGECMAVGIQGCAGMFIDPETGLCDPRPDDCPPGHIPIFSEGCQSVSIPGCVEEFMNPETGLCDPSPEDCPPGYIPVFDEGCVRVGVVDCHPDFIDPVSGHCDPDPDFCAPHHMPVPTQGCVSLDPPGGCGDGTWGHVQELDGDVYVDIGYAGGASDGSRDAPFTVIEDATDAVQAGGRVVLAAGDYPEGVRIKKSFELVGRCSSMVTVSGAKATIVDVDAVIRVNGAVDAAIRDLTVSGPGVGVLVYGGATVEIFRAALVENHELGLLAADGASVNVSDVLIARTVGEPVDGIFGSGILALQGAALTLTRSVLVDNPDVALYAQDSGTTANVTDVLIARSQPVAGGMLGRGVNLLDGAALTLARSVLVDTHNVGLFASAASTADVTEVLIARTVPGPNGSGRGVGVHFGAALTLTRSVLVDNHNTGLHVEGNESAGVTSADVTEVLIARTQATPAIHNSGVTVQGGAASGATLKLTRGVLVDNGGIGIRTQGDGASADVSQVLIARSQPTVDGLGGHGVGVLVGGSLTLTGAVVADNQFTGLFADGNGTSADVAEVLIARTQPRAVGTYGRGVLVQDRAALTLTRSALVDNHEAGLFAMHATASVSDTLIVDTQLGPAGLYGDGLICNDSVVTASAVSSRGNARAGLVYSDGGGDITGCYATDNVIGLVTQTIKLLAGPDIADDNVFEGNAQNVMTDGDLEIPDEMMAVPDLPDFD